MANPVKQLPGNKFYLLVGDGATPTEAFTFLCPIRTITSSHGAEVEDDMIADCDDPTALLQRSSVVKALTWDIEGSGLCDPTKAGYIRLRTQYRAGAPVNLQLMKDLPGASGGEKEQGSFVITKWDESISEGGTVKCSWSFKNQGRPTVTANA